MGEAPQHRGRAARPGASAAAAEARITALERLVEQYRVLLETSAARLVEQFFDAGAKVTEESLRKVGLVKGRGYGVKILGTGEITKALTVTVGKFTEGAKKKIEAAGGHCEISEVLKA